MRKYIRPIKVKQRHAKDETPKHKVVVRVIETEANKTVTVDCR